MRPRLRVEVAAADLFHFDLPWNPGRIEQRNGRIDRKLQPAPEVRSHYCALELLGAEPLARDGGGNGGDRGQARWTFPALDRRTGADPTLGGDPRHPAAGAPAATRSWPTGGARRPSGRSSSRTPACSATTPSICTWSSGWAQRLLARFRAQGFVHHDLSRVCFAQARDSILRVVLLGRLCLHGRRAERLHEESVPLAARWVEPGRRSGPRAFYEVQAKRVEPVGLVYLWPETN